MKLYVRARVSLNKQEFSNTANPRFLAISKIPRNLKRFLAISKDSLQSQKIPCNLKDSY